MVELKNFIYRGFSAEYDDLMKMPIRRFGSINKLVVDPDVSCRYIIQEHSCDLPIDFVYIPGSGNRLLVGFHGAEMRKIADLPKFQFVGSLRSRTEPFVSFADSTLLKNEKLSIGWYAGDSLFDLSRNIAEVIRKIEKVLNFTKTILMGHSAGGLAAIAIGMQIPNSHAISVNGQTIAGIHRPWVIKNLYNSAFPELSSSEEMLERYPDRFDIRRMSSDRSSGATFTLFSHKDDPLSFSEYPHFPLLSEYFGLGSEGGLTEFGDALVPCRWETLNPSAHALPGTVLPFLQATLGEAVGVPITYDFVLPSR
ncbi:hypothetical protein [Glutamicibacter arilaitensis]|uniref:Alpha/beta hydrolase n=1 Tax=Glutamicibacter arilaitensis TaxID=256701 RepID=A0A4Y8U1N2_9MICC|nr:hypothetical protein [Glutamicibacter arilaitensis]TFH57457.1 hypothetical protein EXY26_10915 [Glutamicibacter arilaitensis]